MKDPYPIEKYRYYFTKTKTGNPKIIATSTYAGRTVRGVAICGDGDNYDEETGKKLAAARCAVKVAEKRYLRANKRAEDAAQALYTAERHLNKMDEYLYDAGEALTSAQDTLWDMIDHL